MTKIYKRICNCCGKFYEGQGQKYCSRLCGKSGAYNPFFGKKHLKSTKDKIAKSRIGKSTGSGKKHWNWQGKSLPKKCAECGRKINYRSTYCQKCAYKKERSFWWKGGITKERTKIWKSNKYKQWRKAVFERDNYICQKCGKNNCCMQAHHIKPFVNFVHLRFEVSNGITLCKSCHYKIGHRYKRPNSFKT